MKENIETKDVQKTEYLDKTGLDMLWAKIKENTHNQVEVERNRAVAKENSIIDTKADKSALDNYVLNSALTALEQKVTANTTAIEGKQDAGNYIPYKEIEGGLTYYLQDSYNIMCQKGFSASSSNYDYAAINYNCVKVAKGINNYILIDKDNIEIKDGDYAMALISANSIFSRNRNNDFNFQLTSSGIKLLGGDDNHVLTSNASTIDITEYAKKTDIPEVSTSDFISKTATNITTGGFGQIRTVDTINNNIGVGNNTSSLAYIGEGELGVIGYRNGYATESFRYTNTYGLETTNTSGYKNVKIPCDSNKVSIYKGNSNNYCTDYRYSGVVLGENNDNNNLLNTNGGYKTIGTDIAPLENSKVPTAYLTAATKEELGVVKVGDGLNVTDGTVSVDPEYLVDMMSYGVEWDTTISDPACTRIGNPLLHKQLPIQSEYKGCLVKDGAVNYYLDPNDWSKKADGTPSVLDGTDGDVMVHVPKFYGKSGSNGNKRWVRIATIKIDPSWVEIPEMFVSAYKVTVNEGSAAPKVTSVVNTSSSYRGGNNREGYDKYLSTDKFRTDLGKPRTNISRAAMRTNASNSGQELLCYEFYKWVFYWAYVIEYANFNSQKEFNSELTSDGYHQGGLGQGITTINSNHWNNYNNYYPLTPCGYTNEFGNFSGVKQMIIPTVETDDGITVGSDTTMYANRWRGFENPFGDIWINLDGIVLKRDSANAESKVYTTTDSSKFGGGPSVMNVAGIEVKANGYTKEFDLGETGEIIPQLVGGSESTYKCDHCWCNASSTYTRTLVVGGCAISGGGAGLGDFNSDGAVGYVDSHVGFRSVIRA